MYLTETDPTHTCTIAIALNPMLVDEVDREAETRDGERVPSDGFSEEFDFHDQRQQERDQFIGRYRLIRSIGRGSTGIVWLAQDIDNEGRDVALKIMHADEHDEYVLARYTSEVRALARMDDPHIARIWENGHTFDGKLYIAMELIHGVQLSKFCEAWSPLIRERIGLVIKICRGLQHAHQRGILHRDLKPANILVSHHEGEATPKIIDFGLAKSFLKPLMPGHTDTTQMGCLLGTIGYMSPEQANTSSREVDTRSDVYSVCAILYELLTGTLPIPRDDLNRVSLAKALDMIQHREPDLASRRLQKHSSLGAHAARCQTQPARLIAMLQGDLDAILQKGLSKERELRYQSAGELADDLERYLNGSVVQARRRTSWYVAQKLLRRRWKTALVVSIVSLLFLVSWVGMAFGIFWAVEARDQARHAEASLRITQEQERRFKLDAEKSSSFFSELLGYPNPTIQGQNVKLLDVLDQADRKISERFPQQPRAEMMVRLALARSYLRLGNGARCIKLIQPLFDNDYASVVNDQLLSQQTRLLMVQALITLQQIDKAEDYLRVFIEQPQDLKSSEFRPQLISQLISYAELLESKHLFVKATRLIEDALQAVSLETDKDIPEIGTLRVTHATLYREWAKHDRLMINPAFEVIRKHLSEMSILEPYDPITLQLQSRKAELYSLDQQQKEAQVLFERIAKNAEDHFGDQNMNTQTAYVNLARFYMNSGMEFQAEAKLLKMLPWHRDTYGLQHAVTQMIILDLRKFSEKQGRYWQALGFSVELYQGQSQPPNKYLPSTLMTLKQTRQLAAKAGVQWMGWSLGMW